jgi:hypothetical protein
MARNQTTNTPRDEQRVKVAVSFGLDHPFDQPLHGKGRLKRRCRFKDDAELVSFCVERGHMIVERLVVAAMPLVFARKLEQRPMKLADVIFRDRDVLEGLEHRVHRSRVARDFFFIPAFELLNSES